MSGTPGRPLSSELSEQLLSVAVDILAEEGWGRLNSDRVAARARAGKAGIYRRWPTMAALARHAVGRFRLVSLPEDGGSLRADLVSLASGWSRPLDREERAVASIVGAARHEELLRAGLDDALVRPLAAVVTELGRRSAARGEPIQPQRLVLLGSVLQAFWWQRYTAAGDGAMTPDAVERVVDDVLVPLAAPACAARPEPASV
ncbi:TetR-like C-terminal domain-containing protein [Blastococcus brunescens]|uniref:TetR-like C-terminal domain-containing protein n=1 Tax=Blastococcus brunescens TaxID=1564165 RepID=A0ABZ1B0D0_9ACTN|nr:TetR-like C-terminal domain-containing protein [Blastococcus sp. BMG 8361]WRL64254.1 TetR-like C-terminal domain-containing protein [Blastococcus sp. BMG 8361]